MRLNSGVVVAYYISFTDFLMTRDVRDTKNMHLSSGDVVAI